MTDQATTPQGGELVADEHIAAPEVEAAPEAITTTEEAPAEGLDPNLQHAAPEEDFEDVDFEGKTYKVPKEIKRGILREADYTKKTQELSQHRQAFEGERQAFQQTVAVHQALTQEIGQHHALAAQIAQLDPQAIAELAREDPGLAMQYQIQRQALLEQQAELGRKITQKQQHLAFQQQREVATLKEQAFVTLQRDIPGFNEETVRKIEAFGAQTYGFTVAEFDQVADPRQVKVLHDAMLWREHQAKQQQAQRVAQGQRTAPAPTLRGPSGQFVADPNAMTFEQYKAAREAGKI